MLASMTGFGAARLEAEGSAVTVEAKSVNGRFLKTSLRLPSVLGNYEHELEKLVRELVRRGTVHLTVDLKRSRSEALVVIDEAVVRAYQEAFRRLGIDEGPLATLPGVLAPRRDELTEAEWQLVLAASRQALLAMVAMRRREGEALAQVLEGVVARLADLAAKVRARAPAVVREYHDKLRARVAGLLAEGDLTVNEDLLAREVALFADRADVTEEVDRLRSHLAQVRELVLQEGEVGRSLDFLAQEMLREANTIGSKSADADLARLVIQMKAEIERFKEQVANVE